MLLANVFYTQLNNYKMKKKLISDRISEENNKIEGYTRNIIGRIERIKNASDRETLYREVKVLNDYSKSCLESMNLVEELTWVE